jgi:hypothetical protein
METGDEALVMCIAALATLYVKQVRRCLLGGLIARSARLIRSHAPTGKLRLLNDLDQLTGLRLFVRIQIVEQPQLLFGVAGQR